MDSLDLSADDLPYSNEWSEYPAQGDNGTHRFEHEGFPIAVEVTRNAPSGEGAYTVTGHGRDGTHVVTAASDAEEAKHQTVTVAYGLICDPLDPEPVEKTSLRTLLRTWFRR